MGVLLVAGGVLAVAHVGGARRVALGLAAVQETLALLGVGVCHIRLSGLEVVADGIGLVLLAALRELGFHRHAPRRVALAVGVYDAAVQGHRDDLGVEVEVGVGHAAGAVERCLLRTHVEDDGVLGVVDDGVVEGGLALARRVGLRRRGVLARVLDGEAVNGQGHAVHPRGVASQRVDDHDRVAGGRRPPSLHTACAAHRRHDGKQDQRDYYDARLDSLVVLVQISVQSYNFFLR